MIVNKEALAVAIKLSKKAETLYEAKIYQSIILPDRYNLSLEETAAFISKSRSTVIRYRRIFKQGYLKRNDFKHKKGGRYRSNLTIEQEKEFISSFIAAAQNGSMVNIKKIHMEYEEVFGIKVAESTVYRLMKRHGWRKIMPRPYHPNKDKEKSIAFKGNLKK